MTSWREEWTATSIADAVRTGTASAHDATAEALARIASRDGEIEAFQVVRTAKALDEAAAVDARADKAGLPLAGVPIAVKDNVPVEGEPMRVGSAATSDAPQAEDHAVVKRLRGAGAVVVGLSRVPELCVYGATDSVFGITRNPWDPTRTPGGSSGGSAAAVATGMVPVAHGNDGMGSIRIPAACTGLVGLKPGFGIVPADLGATDWYGMSENGALATTVADTALVMSVLAARPQWAEVSEPDRRLRVALSLRPPVLGVRVDPAYAAAVESVGSVLRVEGHDVRRDSPTYPQGAAIAALVRWFAGAAGDVDSLDENRIEPRVRTHARIGRAVRTSPLMSERLRESWRRKANEYLTQFDVLVTPALAQPPIEAKRWGDGSWAKTMAANIRYAPFAAPWNIAGFPAMTVPVATHPETGTPVAVQLVGRPGTEHLLLSLAATLERVRPWPRVAPAFAGV
ncbi:MAG: amidase family protein [Candidatus Nanopelagicales bacterium]